MLLSLLIKCQSRTKHTQTGFHLCISEPIKLTQANSSDFSRMLAAAPTPYRTGRCPQCDHCPPPSAVETCPHPPSVLISHVASWSPHRINAPSPTSLREVTTFSVPRAPGPPAKGAKGETCSPGGAGKRWGTLLSWGHCADLKVL